jgi:hypothetical protein
MSSRSGGAIVASVATAIVVAGGVLAGGGCAIAGAGATHGGPGALAMVTMLAALTLALGRARRRRRRQRAKGAVSAEFIIAIIPFLLLLLGLLQLSLAGSARLSVMNAAFGAVRAAVVTVPEVPAPSEASGVVGPLKLQRIRDAAIFAVAPSAPAETLAKAPGETSAGTALDDGVDGDGPVGALARIRRKLVAAAGLTAVTLHNGAGARVDRFRDGEAVSARVTFLFPCQVPLAGRFFGRRIAELPSEILNELTSGGLRREDLGHLGGHYLVLQAEHTLSNQ